MKQTAVEYLIDKLLIYDCISVPKDFWYEYLKVIEQAKEMEKEQIKEAHNRGGYILETPEEYYNETYKNGNK